jgi:hypothetical protein
MAKSDSKEDMKMDMAQDKAMIKKAFKMHDKQEHKGGKGTNLSKLKGGGMVGGKTNEGMKMIGRGLEKARASGKTY